MLDKPKDTMQLIVHESDIPHDGKGMLIPQSFTPTAIMEAPKKESRALQTVVRSGVVAAAILMFIVAASVGYGVVSRSGQVAAPVVTVIDPFTLETTTLETGAQALLSQSTFFEETRDAFISDEVTFIDVDITRKQVRYFKHGVLALSAEIINTPEAGSWWDTPSGMYEVNNLERDFYSSLAQVYLPNAISFQENFIIHGTPSYPDGSLVDQDFLGGGIRLFDADVQALYERVTPGTPVLVHVAKQNAEAFVYEPPVPNIELEHYFVGDIESDTVLASSNLQDPVAIASLTKLMTAVVAAEELPLDQRVFVTSPNFVTSLVPRLSNRSSVSMYSLLQLLLVESSNEAAEVIAAELGREEFIAAMNTKARQLGMFNTTFADPSGLGSDNVSTLGDLYQLTKYINQNRSFIIDITHDVNLPTAYEGGDFSGLINFNEIEDTPGFVGGKVGETRAAGQTSISMHELSIGGTTRTIVVIILGSGGRTQDVQTLISFVEEQYGS